MNQAKSCSSCRFAIFEDTGYSNWTVMGTDFSCAKRLHPDGIFDEFYGEDVRLQYADRCEGFEAGESIHMDVDGEEFEALSDDQKAIYKMQNEAP
jgi:hypothetical protein